MSDEEFVLLYDCSFSKNLEIPYEDNVIHVDVAFTKLFHKLVNYCFAHLGFCNLQYLLCFISIFSSVCVFLIFGC